MSAIHGSHPAGHCCAMLINAPGVDAMSAIHGRQPEGHCCAMLINAPGVDAISAVHGSYPSDGQARPCSQWRWGWLLPKSPHIFTR